jgi:uncharacterized protein YegL
MNQELTIMPSNTSSTDALALFDNPATRCPVALLLDTSGSMSGAPIAELNAGFRCFVREVIGDDCARFAVELAVLTFGGSVTVEQPFTSLATAELDEARMPTFAATGGTPMGEAMRQAFGMLEAQKRFYRSRGVPYYQPWMVLLTDGAPTDNVAEASRIVHQLTAERKLVFLGVGVGNGVDMNALAGICPPNRPPKRLAGLRFVEFFQWLSQSMAAVSRSASADARIALPTTDGWDAV